MPVLNTWRIYEHNMARATYTRDQFYQNIFLNEDFLHENSSRLFLLRYVFIFFPKPLYDFSLYIYTLSFFHHLLFKNWYSSLFALHLSLFSERFSFFQTVNFLLNNKFPYISLHHAVPSSPQPSLPVPHIPVAASVKSTLPVPTYYFNFPFVLLHRYLSVSQSTSLGDLSYTMSYINSYPPRYFFT